MDTSVFANEHVALWGDSIGRGVVWNAARARHVFAPETAAHEAERLLGCTIVNRSKFGCTAPMGRDIIERDLAASDRYDAAVVEYGGNDCNFDWAAIAAAPEETHLPATPPETFTDTLKSIVARLSESSVRPILVTLPPIDPERYFRFFVGDRLNGDNVLKWLGDVWRIYRFQELYSLLIADVARQTGAELLDVRARCLALPRFLSDMLCEDGLHLNAEGQRFVGEQAASLALAARG